MKLKHFLGAAAVIGITAFLYLKAQNVDLHHHEDARSALGKLTEASARLSEDVLKLRCALLANYDSLANAQKLSSTTLEELAALYAGPETADEREIILRIAACRTAFAEKGALAEEFKSHSAVLANSLDYLPILEDTLGRSQLENESASVLVDNLLRDTLIYHRSSHREAVPRIRASIKRLGELRLLVRADRQRDLGFMIAHVETVLRTKPAVDALLGRMASIPVAERIEQLRASVVREYDRGVRSAAVYRRALLVLSASLLLAIAFIMAKLQQKAAALTRANIDLKKSAREVARKEAETRAILEGAADGILSLDDQGIVRSINPAAERMFDLPALTVVGRSFETFVSSPWESLKTRLGLKQETLGKTRDGSSPSLELTVSGIDVEDRDVFIVLLQDISERKRVDRLKDEFISNVSHELRTPLTSIRGSLGLVAAGVTGPLPTKAKGLIDLACKNTERLVRLVSDILDVQKIEAGKMRMTFRSTEIMPLVAQAAESHRGYAQSSGVEVVITDALPGAFARLDSDRLMQVIANLLSNACKFSPKGGSVTLGVTRRDKHLRISVSDRGPGIPEAFRSRIFQKFAQAETADTRLVQGKGTGLGLSISKAIAEALGATIGFESVVGQGSTFYLDVLEETRSVAPDEVRSGHRGRILVCDDEADICAVLKAMLEKEGYDADVALGAKEAQDLLALHHYDGMTLDLSMPGKDGLTFIRELRQRSETRELPIVVVSAYSDDGQHISSGEAFGVVDWLAKPIDMRTLSEALESGLEQVQSERPRILHVEDDPDIRELVSASISGQVELAAAATLEEAVGRLKSETFDLVILDLALPDGSGLDLLPALRSSARPSTPVLVFTGQEISPLVARHVSAALKTSTTSNEKLAASIRGFLSKDRASTPATGVESPTSTRLTVSAA